MKVHVGLTAKETFVLADYSADDDWSVSGRLRNSSTQTDAIDLEGSGTSWTLTIPKATTTNYTAGDYTLELIATNDDSEDYLVYEAPVTVVASGALDRRTHNQKVLAALRTVIETKSTKDHAALSIDGQSITRMSWDEILKAEKHYARLVAAEQSAAGGGSRISNVQMRFS